MKEISSLTVEYHENGFKSCTIDHLENLYSFQLQKFIRIFLARTFLFKSLSHFKIRQLLLIPSHDFSKFLSNCSMTDFDPTFKNLSNTSVKCQKDYICDPDCPMTGQVTLKFKT